MRKRRHPHQVMNISELAVGSVYAFVCSDDSGVSCTMRVVGAVMTDTIGQAKRRGHDPSVLRNNRGEPTLYQRRVPLTTLLDDIPLTDTEILTAHLDGWSEAGYTADHPTLSYWKKDDNHVWRGWDEADTHALNSEPRPKPYRTDDRVHIVVLKDHWLADPRLHAAVLDSANESPAEFEQRMRAKKDEAMRRAFFG